MKTIAHYERGVRLLADTYQRRDDLKLVFGKAKYAEMIGHAKLRVQEYAEQHKVDYAKAALEVAKTMPDPANQFALVAFIELIEDES